MSTSTANAFDVSSNNVCEDMQFLQMGNGMQMGILNFRNGNLTVLPPIEACLFTMVHLLCNYFEFNSDFKKEVRRVLGKKKAEAVQSFTFHFNGVKLQITKDTKMYPTLIEFANEKHKLLNQKTKR